MSNIAYTYITRLVVKNYRSLQAVDLALKNLTVVVDGQLVQIPLTIDGILMRNPNDQNPKQLSRRSFYLSQLGLVVPSIQAVRDFLINMSFYDLSPIYMREPQKATLPVQLLENGHSFANFMQKTQEENKDYLITQALGVAIKGIEGYSIMPVGQHLVTKLHYAFPNGDLRKAVSDLSDEANGTIRLLATLAALYQKRFPSPLIIEEPEKEIYPDALELLSDMLEVASDHYQIIISTHSPDLITYLPAPESLRIVNKVLGVTKIGPISKEQDDTISENISLMRFEGLERRSE